MSGVVRDIGNGAFAVFATVVLLGAGAFGLIYPFTAAAEPIPAAIGFVAGIVFGCAGLGMLGLIGQELRP